MRSRRGPLRFVLGVTFALALLMGFSWPVVAGTSLSVEVDHSVALDQVAATPPQPAPPGLPAAAPAVALDLAAATPPPQPGMVCIAHQTRVATDPVILIEVAPDIVPALERHGDTVVGPAPCPASAAVVAR